MTDPSVPFEQAIDTALARGELACAERLVYADWLDEWGDFAWANLQRWLAEHGKTPRHVNADDGPATPWEWWNEYTPHDFSERLPASIFRQLIVPANGRYWPSITGCRSKDFPTSLSAEQSLAEALVRLQIIGG